MHAEKKKLWQKILSKLEVENQFGPQRIYDSIVTRSRARMIS